MFAGRFWLSCVDVVFMFDCVNSVDLILYLILNLKYVYVYWFCCVLVIGWLWMFGCVVWMVVYIIGV